MAYYSVRILPIHVPFCEWCLASNDLDNVAAISVIGLIAHAGTTARKTVCDSPFRVRLLNHHTAPFLTDQ